MPQNHWSRSQMPPSWLHHLIATLPIVLRLHSLQHHARITIDKQHRLIISNTDTCAWSEVHEFITNLKHTTCTVLSWRSALAFFLKTARLPTGQATTKVCHELNCASRLAMPWTDTSGRDIQSWYNRSSALTSALS